MSTTLPERELRVRNLTERIAELMQETLNGVVTGDIATRYGESKAQAGWRTILLWRRDDKTATNMGKMLAEIAVRETCDYLEQVFEAQRKEHDER